MSGEKLGSLFHHQTAVWRGKSSDFMTVEILKTEINLWFIQQTQAVLQQLQFYDIKMEKSRFFFLMTQICDLMFKTWFLLNLLSYNRKLKCSYMNFTFFQHKVVVLCQTNCNIKLKSKVFFNSKTLCSFFYKKNVQFYKSQKKSLDSFCQKVAILLNLWFL